VAFEIYGIYLNLTAEDQIYAFGPQNARATTLQLPNARPKAAFCTTVLNVRPQSASNKVTRYRRIQGNKSNQPLCSARRQDRLGVTPQVEAAQQLDTQSHLIRSALK
jgi:hypothetical protein